MAFFKSFASVVTKVFKPLADLAGPRVDGVPSNLPAKRGAGITLGALIIFSIFESWDVLGSPNIELVKRGILTFDQSVTVGDALEGYSWFKDVSWEEITTPQNRGLVRVSAEITDPQFVQQEREGWAELLGEQNTAGSVKTVHLRVVFVINKSDSTFQIADGVFDEVTDQGKSLSIPFPEQTSVKLLQHIWANHKLTESIPLGFIDQLRLQALHSSD